MRAFRITARALKLCRIASVRDASERQATGHGGGLHLLRAAAIIPSRKKADMESLTRTNFGDKMGS